MAGKLEIRVIPKEPQSPPPQSPQQQPQPQSPKQQQRPQTLSPPSKPPQIAEELRNNDHAAHPPDPPKIKLERTKSILKQSSRERTEHPELHSPKRENITFAPELLDLEKQRQEKEGRKLLEKRVSVEKIVCPLKARKPEEEDEEESESSESSSEEDEDDEQKRKIGSPIRRISITRSNSRINFEPVESLNPQKTKPKPMRGSRSDSSSSTNNDPVVGKKCAKTLDHR